MANLVVPRKGEAQEPIISSPSSKNIRQAQLLAITTEDIEDTFRRGYITASQRNAVLREKAHAVTNEMIADKGFFGAVLEKTMKGIQKGWDDIVESAKETKKAEDTSGVSGVLERAKPAGMALWGSIQTLTSVFSAVGTVSGQQAERWALGAGASPGLARLINISVDVGSGFYPVGKSVQQGVKGVQNVIKVGGKAVEKETAAITSVAERAVVEEVAEDAIRKSLAVEGIGEAVQTAPAKMAPSVAEKFAEDFNIFRRQMESVTERQSHAQTARLADRLGLDLEDLRNVVPGQALDEKQMYAYLKALEPQVDEAIRLAKTVSNSEADANAFAAHMSDLFTLAPIFRGAEVTAGRSVEILKETPPMKKITDMLMGWDAEAMANGNFQQAIRTMADDILAASETPERLSGSAIQMQSLWGQFKETVWPMARETYYNLMLARPVTHVRNFIGNSVAAGNAIVERTVGGVFSLDKQNGLVGQEGWFLLKGYTAGVADGLHSFGKAFTGPIGPDELSKLDYIPHQIPGIAGRIINTPGDVLRGTDNFFRAVLRRGSYYSDALREGTHKGLNGDELSDFVAKRVNSPNAAMRASADEFATHNTYQDQLGALSSRIRDVAQVGPMVLWFPFMKTPINLAKYAWDRTPGLQLISGQLYRDIGAGGVKADEAMARITMATMYGQVVYQLAQEGYITGSGPVDAGLRRAWLATHQPYSVKTKDGWMPITNFEPGNTPIGLMADFAQIHNQLDDPSAEQIAMAATFSVIKGLADKTYWRTLSDIVDLASGLKLGHEPGVQGRDVLISPAMTVATGGPLVGAITRQIDPIQRETRTLVDSFMSRIPGYSKDVPPIRDIYGEPVLPPQAVGGQYLNMVQPLYEKDISKDRVRQEGNKLQIKVPSFPWVVGGTTRDDFDIRAPFPEDLIGVELTPKQRDRAQVLFKEYLRNPEFGIEAGLLNLPEYNNPSMTTRAGQRELFMDSMAGYRKMAIDTLMIEDTSIGTKLIQSQANKVLPLLQRNDQDQLKRETSEALDLFNRMAPEMRENLLRWGTAPGED